MKTLILLLLILPGILQAQIFRCGPKGDTYFSQIPCADNSEVVVIEDRLMFSEATPDVGKEQEEAPPHAEPVKSQAENMQEFVSTLNRQRSEQLGQIDREIGAMEARLKAIGDDPSDRAQREQLAKELTGLQSSRGSIVEQYQSMILEAERRVIALSGHKGAADRNVN